ncbi:hypothetical protein [Phaeospirillum tilakii]|uniref:Uncharacterized protein n=1 Tax=Phaeospirillum tilakii TaxID=741673 RepID=A0ABW5CHA1_9PROT
MRFLFLMKWPLNQRNVERFGLQAMLDRGHQVTVLDMMRACHPNARYHHLDPVKDPRLEVRRIDTWSQLTAEAATFAQADMIMLMIQSYGLSEITLPSLRMIAAAGRPYTIFMPTLVPGEVGAFEELPLRRKLREFGSRLKKASFRNSLVHRLPPKWLGIPPAALAVYPARASEIPNNLIGPQTQAIHTHSWDYDQFLARRDSLPEAVGQAVFIDQYLPFHPDFRLAPLKTPIEPNRYYGGLRALFDRIERELGLEVVIAAHPQSDYSLHPGVFGDRRIQRGGTLDQVAASKLVLGHLSVGIGFAVMCRKPLMFIISSDLYEGNPSFAHSYDVCSSLLNSPLHRIDDPGQIDLGRVLEFDASRFQAYTEDYLAHPLDGGERYWDAIGTAIENFVAKAA